MIEILYVSDSMVKAAEFINELLLDLQEIGVYKHKNYIDAYNAEKKILVVGNIEVRGISVYASALCDGMDNIKYFIDGIDMKAYKNASKRDFDVLIYRIRQLMLHFKEDTKQLSGKDELIKILTENAK